MLRTRVSLVVSFTKRPTGYVDKLRPRQDRRRTDHRLWRRGTFFDGKRGAGHDDLAVASLYGVTEEHLAREGMPSTGTSFKAHNDDTETMERMDEMDTRGVQRQLRRTAHRFDYETLTR